MGMKNKNKDRNVIKIGGSVLRDEESYKNEALKVKEFAERTRGDRISIVSSAIFGETDRLLASVLDGYIYRKEVESALRGESDENCIDECARKEVADSLLIGEIKSTRIFSKALRDIGVENKVFAQGNDYPIIANTGYLKARVDFEASKERFVEIDKEIKERVVLFVGFGAENKDEERVLLGRNSSDYIAAIIGSLDDRVERVIFRKDVDGLYLNYGLSNQSLVTNMSYDEARELLERNPKVLHGGVLEVANGYDILIENCNKPIGSGGTLIKDYKSFMGGDSGPD